MMWNFSRYKDSYALIDDAGNKVSYTTLENVGIELAKAIGHRCLVFSLCKNEIGSVFGYTAFMNNKIVPVLLNAHLDDELLFSLVDNYSPEYLWVPNESVSKFDNVDKVAEYYEYSLLKTNFTVKYPLNDALALLLTTSGSTGSPKFVRQSYENVSSNAKSIVEYLEIDSSERPITTLPMNYTYGLSIINSHLMAGATILLTEKTLMQKEFWVFLEESRATSFGGVPYTYEMLNRLRFFNRSNESIRYMTQAGGKLSPELHKKFAEYAQANGKKFIVMYGQCEATARMGYLPAEHSVDKFGSMGIAIPGGELFLVDDENQVISGAGTEGELVYKGPNVTLGYAECGEDLVLDDERNGILHTGDIAKRDEDGFFYIVGRKKRFLKIFGNRVNLDELDRIIKEKYENLQCASTGVDDHLHVFVCDESLTEDVRKFVIEKTGFNPSAIKVAYIEELPMNDSGKIKYKDLLSLI